MAPTTTPFSKPLYSPITSIASNRSRNLFHDRRFAIPAGCGPIFARNMSSLGEGPPENVEIMTDKAVDVASQVGPVANEVAIAAADSSMPVAAIQYLIDYVHCYTGFNWWASIVAAAILIRSIQLPLSIHLFKSHLKFELQRPRMEETKKILRNTDTSPAEKQARTKEIKKILVGIGFAVSTGLLISFPIFCCSFLAVKNMAENVPSFKEGGALWFTDLSTPDTMFIPILTALTIWIKGTLYKGPLVFAALTIPFDCNVPESCMLLFHYQHPVFSCISISPLNFQCYRSPV
ncbi:hypothetical protein ABFX02_05G108500 [Erythranthe guttata]